MRKVVEIRIKKGEGVNKNLRGEKKEKMKTKNKIVALVEIAIVLCSVFLMALPAIAAEQNQEMQELSANTITTASEDDFVLGIYGNANEDDTIDMRDLTYVKLIFFGKKPETELADAKYDGKINPLDFIQIKLIIVGKEKELTIVDSADRIVTVKKPVERIIPVVTYAYEALRTLNAADKIVGVVDYVTRAPRIYMGELCDLPCIGSYIPDYEVVLSLDPDLVIAGVSSFYDVTVDKLESVDPTLPILRMDLGGSMGYEHGGSIDLYPMDIRKMGYILDRKDEAEEFIDWYYGIIDHIKDRTDELSDDEKTRVLYGTLSASGWYIYNKYSTIHDVMEIAGGRNIAADIENLAWHDAGYVDLEWAIEQDPEMIVRYYLPSIEGAMGLYGTYGIDDTTEIIAIWEEVMNRPEFANVAAVKSEKVHMLAHDVIGHTANSVAIAYFAKIFHPELFEDLDPQTIHQEFLTRFQRIDYVLDEHGVFVYPEL